MKIVADENIPQVEYFFGAGNTIQLKSGRAISQADLLDADVLLVRAVTQVNHALIENTPIRYVGSVTSGMDHVDTAWLDAKGIAWNDASGCNGRAVVEYVTAVIARLQKDDLLPQKKIRAAVIGVGAIGKQVVSVLEALGCDVLQCDPIRDRLEDNFTSCPLEEIKEVDFISLHTPLTLEGEFATYHLIGQDFLARQKKNCVLVNASRGEVIDFSKLEEYGQHLYWCLDVWNNEPYIDFEILQTAIIATPHIAGYSVQSKLRGIEMIYQAASQQQGLRLDGELNQSYPQRSQLCAHAKDWRDVVLDVFDPAQLTEEMKVNLTDNSGISFDEMRKGFNDRYEFEFIELIDLSVPSEDVGILEMLGFRLNPKVID